MNDDKQDKWWEVDNLPTIVLPSKLPCKARKSIQKEINSIWHEENKTKVLKMTPEWRHETYLTLLEATDEWCDYKTGTCACYD